MAMVDTMKAAMAEATVVVVMMEAKAVVTVTERAKAVLVGLEWVEVREEEVRAELRVAEETGKVGVEEEVETVVVLMVEEIEEVVEVARGPGSMIALVLQNTSY